MKSESARRNISIDLLRGLTVAGMILVNNPGTWSNMYWPLKHAKWNGCTPTDLVFPFFLFVVGAAIPFSVRNGLQVFPKILKRSLILIGLGLFLNIFGEWSFAELRFPGVLQRIGFTYFFCALIYTEKNLKFRIFIFSVLLIGYWILLGFLPPPGADLPTMTEGKDWGAWLDRTVFGEKHLWKFGKVWDPEGLLTSISAFGSVLAGIFTGEFLKKELEIGKSGFQIPLHLLFLGIGFLLLGGIWDLWFPINKSLWTSSYTLWTAGWAVLFLSLFSLLENQDTFLFRSLQALLLPFGRNALLVFFGSGMYARSLNIISVHFADGKKTSLKNYIYVEYYKSWIESPELSSFAYTITVILLWFFILYFLDKKKIYWKI
nr:DUF5009 domain-containing protein [Leptospira semungkisensis]